MAPVQTPFLVLSRKHRGTSTLIYHVYNSDLKRQGVGEYGGWMLFNEMRPTLCKEL